MTPRPRTVLLGLAAAAAVALAGVVATVAPGSPLPAALGRAERPSVSSGEAVPAVLDDPVVRIAVAGDTGTGEPAEALTAESMAAQSQADPYDALVLLGDLVYPDGDSALVKDVVLDPFAPVLRQGAELVPVLGNHDYQSGEQGQIMTALGRDAPWYEAQVGPVRILVLDSSRVDDPDQTRWLRDALAAPQPSGTWTLAAMHHPAYSAGQHGSDMAVRAAWAPLFADHDVPLVLAGHDHDYQRSLPQDGVTYVVSGAGAKLRPAGREDFTAVSASTLHYVDLLVFDDRLEGRAVDQSGRLVDTFTITR
ncbi:metallophosphoesterase family protein [Jannaschia sp. R86511]|uniref:metallophosphoesterase family protein n=1 Tax=Jannaschia sp. R86511 TaxID=3093853 RepID=UPI0036D3F905